MPLSKTQLYLLSKQSPHLALLEFMKEMEAKHEKMIQEMVEKCIADLLPEITEKVRTEHDQKLINEATTAMLENLQFKGEKGDSVKGDGGEKPIKGIDYLTSEEIQQIISEIQSQIIVPKPKDGITPKAGIDFPSYEEIEKMVKLQTDKLPRQEFDEKKFLEEIKKTYPRIEIKGKDVVEIINGLPIEPEFQIDASHIKNLPRATAKTRQISGAGKGAGLGTAALLTISGTINDTNTTFTTTEEPAVLLINGGMYRKTGGAITWTYSSGTIVLSQPVGTNGAIYGIR